MNNPIKNLSKKEWVMWIGSIVIVFVSNVAASDFDLLTLTAALVER